MNFFHCNVFYLRTGLIKPILIEDCSAYGAAGFSWKSASFLEAWI